MLTFFATAGNEVALPAVGQNHYTALCFVLCALIALFAYFIIHRKYRNAPSPLLIAFLMISIAIFSERLPLRIHDTDLVGAIPLSILDVLRCFTMNVDFAPIQLSKETIWGTIYQWTDIVLALLAPLCTLGVVLTLFNRLLHRLNIRLFFWKQVHYFSELNEKSITLANSILENHRKSHKWFSGISKPFFVFCRVKKDDSENPSYENAEQLDAVFYSAPIHSIRVVSPRRRRSKLFLIDMNEETNIHTLLKMESQLYRDARHALLPLAWTQQIKRLLRTVHISFGTIRSDIYVFSTSDSSELLFDQLLDKLKEINGQKPTARCHPARLNYMLHLIDETKLIVQKLLLEHPLFEAASPATPDEDSIAAEALQRFLPTERKSSAPTEKISVLSIGSGGIGMEFLRTAIVCGVMDSYSFRFQVIDKDAAALESRFRQKVPYLYDIKNGASDPLEIGKAYCPEFHTADVCDHSFTETLEAHCKECNYILVCTGDDELNITTANYLRRWYGRQSIRDGYVPTSPPIILTAIRSTERFEAIEKLNIPNFHFFGKHGDVFSAEQILSRPLDSTAALCNAFYDSQNQSFSMHDLCSAPTERKDFLLKYYGLKNTSLLSNQLVALHGIYKLQDLLHRNGEATDILSFRKNPNQPEAFFRTMLRLLKEQEASLLTLEHRRWQVAQLLSGWELLKEEMIAPCWKAGLSGRNKRHQIPDLKLHVCLSPMRDIEKLPKKLNEMIAEYNRVIDKAAKTTPNAHEKESVKAPDEFVHYDIAMCYAALFVWIDLELTPNAANHLRKVLHPSNSSNRVLSRKEFPDHLLKQLPSEQTTAKA